MMICMVSHHDAFTNPHSRDTSYVFHIRENLCIWVLNLEHEDTLLHGVDKDVSGWVVSVRAPSSKVAEAATGGAVVILFLMLVYSLMN